MPSGLVEAEDGQDRRAVEHREHERCPRAGCHAGDTAKNQPRDCDHLPGATR